MFYCFYQIKAALVNQDNLALNGSVYTYTLQQREIKKGKNVSLHLLYF